MTHPALHPQVLADVRVALGEELVQLEVVHRGGADPGVHEIGDGRSDESGTDHEAALDQHRHSCSNGEIYGNGP